MFSSAEGALLTPVIFYDLFDKPLKMAKLGELAHGVLLGPDLIEQLIDELTSRTILARVGEYVTIAGRESIVDAWYERELQQRLLWAESEAVISCLASVPFVKTIAVANSLALGTANKDSDIDLVVIVEAGWLAVARDHMLTRLEILGRRAHKLPKQGKVFPDIILGTDRMELSTWRLEPSDIYLDYWLARLQPVLDRDGTYSRLMKANSWLMQTFPGWQPQTKYLIETDRQREQHRRSWEAWYRSLPGKLMSAGQKVWYAQRMLKYRSKLGAQALVVAGPNLLRIHEPDKRPVHQQAFEARWQALEQAAARITSPIGA